MTGGSPNVAATPIPVAAPPVTPDSATAIQTQQDFRRQQLKKKGFMSTYKAGDTGGYSPTGATPSPGNQPTTGMGAKTLGT